MKRKKLLIIIPLIILLIAAISFFIGNEGPKPVTLDTNEDGKPDYRINFRGPSDLEWSQETEEKEYKFMTETVHTYRLKDKGEKVGTITLTLRQLEGKDVIYYIKYEHTRPIFNLEAVISSVDEWARAGRNGAMKINGHQIKYGSSITNQTSFWGSFDIEYSHGEDLPVNAVFLDSPTHYLRIGLVDVFKPLKNQVREEHIEKSVPIAVSRVERDINYNITFPEEIGYFVENWGILSSRQLIDWSAAQAVDAARAGDLVRYRKFSTDGIYYLTPWNYYPSDKTTFWLNPASTHHVAGMFSRYDAGSYFRDIAITSMYSAIETQTKDFYWLSSPRSDWLYQEYGIPSGFYDTRFSTDVAMYLLDMYEKTGEKLALEASQNYAIWLRKYIDEQGIPTSGGGMLVPDYFKKGFTHKKTNVSLNHLVSEMNFLYRLYLIDNDFANFKSGNLIRQGVRDTGRNWIREDGDLHYAYLGEGKYGMQDYPLLTLNDLRTGQKLIKAASKDGQSDDVFQMLITAKERFLIKNNKPIR